MKTFRLTAEVIKKMSPHRGRYGQRSIKPLSRQETLIMNGTQFVESLTQTIKHMWSPLQRQHDSSSRLSLMPMCFKIAFKCFCIYFENCSNNILLQRWWSTKIRDVQSFQFKNGNISFMTCFHTNIENCLYACVENIFLFSNVPRGVRLLKT